MSIEVEHLEAALAEAVEVVTDSERAHASADLSLVALLPGAASFHRRPGRLPAGGAGRLDWTPEAPRFPVDLTVAGTSRGAFARPELVALHLPAHLVC